jgi:hypothetical protein
MVQFLKSFPSDFNMNARLKTADVAREVYVFHPSEIEVLVSVCV